MISAFNSTSPLPVRHQLPRIGAKRRSGQAGFVQQVRLGVVAPGEADGDGLGDRVARHDERFAVDRRGGGHEFLIFAGDAELREDAVVFRHQSAGGVLEFDPQFVVFDGVRIVKRAAVDDFFRIRRAERHSASRRPTSCLLRGWMSFTLPMSVVTTMPVFFTASSVLNCASRSSAHSAGSFGP